jgi:hypothetical protein
MIDGTQNIRAIEAQRALWHEGESRMHETGRAYDALNLATLRLETIETKPGRSNIMSLSAKHAT